jgi:anti-sigma B factor antagonist
MTVEQRAANDVVILAASGEITYGKGSDVLLRKTIDTLLAEGHRKVILDVGGITYVDSAGLGQLAQMHATASRRQASLKLVRVSTRLRDLLVATRLLPLFQLFETEDAALASFGPASPARG